MSNLERYIEDNSKRLVTDIEAMLASVARQTQELNGDSSKMYFGGVSEEDLTRVQRARADLHTPTSPDEIVEALNNPTDPFNEAEDLYGKLVDMGNDADQSDYIIDEDDDGDDSYRHFGGI